MVRLTIVCNIVCIDCLQKQTDPTQTEALKVHLRGWDSLLGYQDKPVPLCDLVDQLKEETIVQKLLEDAALVRELLSRMSWLAILLATAAFTGAITPPGGWDSGRLFLPYAGNNNSVDTCADPLAAVNQSGGNNSKPADSAKDARCPTTVQFGSMRAYNTLVMLTFGISISLVLFLVAFSIPSIKVVPHNRQAMAGHMYDQLVFATFLMVLTVACGTGAITAALVAVYPVGLVVSDMWAPFAVSSLFLLVALVVMAFAFSNMWPGCAAVWHPFQDILAVLLVPWRGLRRQWAAFLGRPPPTPHWNVDAPCIAAAYKRVRDALLRTGDAASRRLTA